VKNGKPNLGHPIVARYAEEAANEFGACNCDDCDPCDYEAN
jgi:hypothetical protein